MHVDIPCWLKESFSGNTDPLGSWNFQTGGVASGDVVSQQIPDLRYKRRVTQGSTTTLEGTSAFKMAIYKVTPLALLLLLDVVAPAQVFYSGLSPWGYPDYPPIPEVSKFIPKIFMINCLYRSVS